jgi:23S rRNA (cytidine2498-2'-O)-methyltransferase
VPTNPPAFIFATCNPGSEPSLKAEFKAAHGDALAPAFMRPGLITWKMLREDVRLRPEYIFAHVAGHSLGMARDEKEFADLLSKLEGKSFHTHFIPRAFPENGWSQNEWQTFDERCEAMERGRPRPQPTVKSGDLILDVILGEPNEPLLLGNHTHHHAHPTTPGAIARIILPSEAPSRAWLKMEQALSFAAFDTPAKLAGKTALELGSAPGGASWSLLNRGMKVIGVDTAAMDERVRHFSGTDGAGFMHINASAGDLAKIALPPVDMLVSDMNLAPPVALKYIERLQHRVKAAIMVLTLKINDREMESRIPAFLDQIRAFAPGEVRATQLPANRREITVVIT